MKTFVHGTGRLRRLYLVTRAVLPELHRRNELGVVGGSEFIIPTHQLVGDLMRRVGAEVEAIREMSRGGMIDGFHAKVRHMTPLLQARDDVKLRRCSSNVSKFLKRAAAAGCDNRLLPLSVG